MRSKPPCYAIAFMTVFNVHAASAWGRDAGLSRIPLAIDSGPVTASNRGHEPQLPVLFEYIAHVPQASSLRLIFAEAPITRLSGDPGTSTASRVRMVSLLDGASQTLTSERLAEWKSESAYFNGDAVLVQLIGGEPADWSRIVIVAAIAGFPTSTHDRSICGNDDDRVLSTDPRVARTFSGCTAWLFNDLNSMFLTAGHCIPDLSSVAMFNVPLSTVDGQPQFPPPIDQYAIELTSNQALSGGVGADWQYFGCYCNSESALTPFQRQQSRYVLASIAPAAADGRTIRVTGNGAVSPPISRTWNAVQKSHLGAYLGVFGNALRHTVDTTGGNSGSPVVDEQSGQVIGIHTHEGCASSPDSYNQGTVIHSASLQAALANPRGICGTGRAAAGGGLFVAGDQANNFGTVNPQLGAFGRIKAVAAPMQGLAFDPDAHVFWCSDNHRYLHRLDGDSADVLTSVQLSGVAGVVNGLAFDPVQQVLYGMIAGGGQLVRIDRLAGAMTAIGPARGGNIAGLEFDPLSHSLFGIDDTPAGSRLVRISVIDGTQTVIGAMGIGTDCNGLSWGGDPRWPRLYTIDSATDRLLRVNPRTGVAVVVGPTLGMFGSMYGMASNQPLPSSCPGDYDQSGSVSLQDLFDYLSAWFAESTDADVNASGLIELDDLYQFLQDWLLGPCIQ